MNAHDHEQGQGDTRPYLCIPYWNAALGAGGTWDTGAVRPLPDSVVGYLCDSVHAGPYTPGQPLDVTVDVRNSGGGNAASVVTVVVYWADPTAGFAKPNFFSACTVAVPPTRTTPGSTPTPKMTSVIPASAPAHVCLLVAVSHPQDPAGTVANPAGDRHWAQRNLQAAVVAPGAPAIMPFLAGNPFAREGEFVLQLGPAERERAVRVAREVGTEAGDAPANLRLLDADGAALAEAGLEVRLPVALGPREERRFQVIAEVGGGLPQGQSIVLEAVLLDHDGEHVAGSLGLVLTAP
jgi:hypothetical protein